MKQVLKDKTFISTRPKKQFNELDQLFTNAGANFVEMPLIQIQSTRLSPSAINCLAHLDRYHWLIFTSSNGVKYFFQHVKKYENTQLLPGSVQIAVIGNKTEKTLNDFGYPATFKNPGSTAKDFADAFLKKIKHSKPNILLALGNIARTLLQEKLAEYADCTRINVYETTGVNSVDPAILDSIKRNEYDLILFSSPSGINQFIQHTTAIHKQDFRIACIGETTAQAASDNNIRPRVVAKNSTASGLFNSIVDFYNK